MSNYYQLIEFSINKEMVISYDRSKVYLGGSGVFRVRAESFGHYHLKALRSWVKSLPIAPFFLTSCTIRKTI